MGRFCLTATVKYVHPVHSWIDGNMNTRSVLHVQPEDLPMNTASVNAKNVQKGIQIPKISEHVIHAQLDTDGTKMASLDILKKCNTNAGHLVNVPMK